MELLLGLRALGRFRRWVFMAAGPQDRLPTRRAVLATAAALAGCAKPPPPTVRLSIESDGDYLAFRPDKLSAPAGAHVVLTLAHRGKILSQEHDWVLARPGTMPSILADSDRASLAAHGADASFLKPGDPRIIASTGRIKKGQTTTIEFTAPGPGDYPFFCSTPGHAEDMQGVLHVTAN
ncbi:MAG TPA: plastocyanin/azurin family copper-binding protein [Caulobacteraceae bacterium]|nr:plastocyanin/azurin family copper-binding protein [Caulobacteraceae bacterium]